MSEGRKKIKTKGEKTLATSLGLSAPGPLLTGISVLMSWSTTQIADFLRRTTELIAIFVSWFIYRKLQQKGEYTQAEKDRLEGIANYTVGAAMGCSGGMMLVIALIRLPSYDHNNRYTF